MHASLGIPGGRGLLLPLYRAVATQQEKITISKNLNQCFKDWKLLIKAISKRLTSVLELVPHDPHYIGYVDSSKSAVGGVWTSGTKQIQPTVWRLKWPAQIQQQLISASNKAGNLTINDLELAGILLAWLVLEKITPPSLQHAHTGIFCDNNSAVAWMQKKSTSTSTIAGHLLRAIALRQHTNKSTPLQVLHIPGKENSMADVASRSFNDNIFKTSNQNFLQNFSKLFPLQTNSWKEFHLP